MDIYIPTLTTDIIDKIKEISLSARTKGKTTDIISYIIERQIKDINSNPAS